VRSRVWRLVRQRGQVRGAGMTWMNLAK